MIINLMVLASLMSGFYPYSVQALGDLAQKSLEPKPALTQSVADIHSVREVWVTAYSSTPEETDDTPFTAASGKTVRDGFMASNFLKFGTRVRVPELFGDRVFVIEDRMARRKTDFVDIWMPTKQDALNFGIHRAKIVILN